MSAGAVYVKGKEGTPQVLRARIAPPSDATSLITQSSLNGISYKSWKVRTPVAMRLYGYLDKYLDEPEDPDPIQASGTLVVADVILDDPQDWDRPSGQYNFLAVIPAVDLGDVADDDLPQWVRIDVTFDPVVGDDYTITWYVELYPTPA